MNITECLHNSICLPHVHAGAGNCQPTSSREESFRGQPKVFLLYSRLCQSQENMMNIIFVLCYLSHPFGVYWNGCCSQIIKLSVSSYLFMFIIWLLCFIPYLLHLPPTHIFPIFKNWLSILHNIWTWLWLNSFYVHIGYFYLHRPYASHLHCSEIMYR